MNNDFDSWWEREGQFIDPDTDYVPWCYKRKEFAALAWTAANAASTNYVADHEVYPHVITFRNGRVVAMKGQGHLFVSLKGGQ